ncbi:MAG TPA: 2-C-methyl-D-erythritol 4-phosphate cytidylyltransferase [Miltoncostaeaceae bacterium]|nr:2-C-methyl-D-erythritol 4-phosphate cytidylyltransferase [Miltoncostaeaceae bacterium]
MPTPTVAIVVAAGAGTRMGAPVPKALMPLAGRPMLSWSLDALRASGAIEGIVVVAPPGLEGQVAEVAGRGVTVVPGGASRAESVREGLRATPPGTGIVLVHDAARPLVTPELLRAVIDGVEEADGAIAAAPAADTLKRAGEGGFIEDTVPRQGLWGAQTPQAFHLHVLAAAVEAAEQEGRLAAATDCASLLEARGGHVRLVESRAPNLKVTTPADATLAEALLNAR